MAFRRDQEPRKDAQQSDAKVIFHGPVDNHARQEDRDRGGRRKKDRRNPAPPHQKLPSEQENYHAQAGKHLFNNLGPSFGAAFHG
jgi:hypothetical protein